MEPTHCLPGHVHGMVREWPGGESHRCGDHPQPAKRWRMEDGGWRMEGGGRREEVEGGGWRVEGGGRREEGGGRREEGESVVQSPEYIHVPPTAALPGLSAVLPCLEECPHSSPSPPLATETSLITPNEMKYSTLQQHT